MTKTKQNPKRLELLSTQEAQMKARITTLDASNAVAERNAENRAIWLLGRLFHSKLATNPIVEELVRCDLPEHLTSRDLERGIWQLLFPLDVGVEE